jgi:LmbE family N-acetylglucosaminyl deacetylase
VSAAALMNSRLLRIAILVLAGCAAAAHAQVRHVYDRGAAGVLQKIQELRTTASVLLIGAHPDDEDSAFIARAARGDHARVAYLSLNRGEGGQNVIGPELYDALGVIRTEELLQARALDGSSQFFTRTYDFGFSKTLAEASLLWGDQDVLRDMVRVIREFRPLVVYSIFSGTPADGHGHHQLAGKLAPIAYRAAGDPAQFPELAAEGLRPWRPLKLYRAAEENEKPTTVVETGQLDPLVGRSYAEIAAEGRSQHKSQAQGTEEVRGPVESDLVLLDPAATAQDRESSVFDGIDTSIPAIAAMAGLPVGALKSELEALDASAARAFDNFDIREPARSVKDLAAVLEAVRAARAALKTAGATAAAEADADFTLAQKEKEAIMALQQASGTVIDALSSTETAAPGESFSAAVRVFLSEPSLVKISQVTLRAPAGWLVQTAPRAPAKRVSAGFFAIREIADREDTFTLTVPEDAPPTQPYWLKEPRKGYLYTWPDGSPKAQPFDQPIVTAAVQAVIGGASVTLTQPLQFRLIDQARGELRRNVDVVPAVTVSFDSPLEVVPLSSAGKARRVVVRLQSNRQSALSGSAKVEAPPGWRVSPSTLPFSLERKGEHYALPFDVTPPRGVLPGRYSLQAVAESAGRRFDLSMRTVAYQHIQTHRLYSPAQAQVQLIDLNVEPVKIGYIMGSGDLVPDALRRMGLDVSLLDEDALAAGDLSKFDTIVAGIRASEVRPDFIAANERLLDYVRAGGTLIVQYQQGIYTARKLPPFPVSGVGDRVTDEAGPVRILAPDNPVFTTPNRIGLKDFEGWVQDRNLYAFNSFDPRYVPLLEAHDPGEPEQKGGEVYARLGKGNYVYTAYAWFRQLPAGVPGAYRLFANLVSLGHHRR